MVREGLEKTPGMGDPSASHFSCNGRLRLLSKFGVDMVRKSGPNNRGPAAKTETFKLPVSTEGPCGTSLLGNALTEDVFL